MEAIIGYILNPHKIRGNDKYGSGQYNTSRRRVGSITRDTHKGVDIEGYPGQSVKAGIDGTVVRKGKAYSNDGRYDSIHIEGIRGSVYEGVRLKMLYVKATVNIGETVKRNQTIGIVQNLDKKYAGITNHVHLEVFFHGVRLDPTHLFGTPKQQERLNEFQLSKKRVTVDVVGKVFTYTTPTEIDTLMEDRFFDDVDISKQEFLSVEFEGKTNHRRVYESLTAEEKVLANNGSEEYNDKIEYKASGVVELYIPTSAIIIEKSYTSNATIINVKDTTFFPSIIKKLTNDPGYVRVEDNPGTVGKTIIPQVSVWLWSRTKYLEEGGVDGFIEITNDVEVVTTESSISGGGNFSIELSSIVAKKDSGVWEKQSEDYIQGNINRVRNFTRSKQKRSEYVDNNFYYEKIVQQNDLIFISYEKLIIDEGKVGVADKNYDMIGLVDSVEVSGSAAGNDISISVRGRDLIKPFQDDSSLFNPYSVGHVNSLYGGDLGDQLIDGKFHTLSAMLPRSIRDSVEFIISRIVSVKYCPNDIFTQFSNRSTVTSTIGEEEKDETKGIWQLIKVFVDPSVSDLRVIDDSIANPQGSMLDIIRKVAQEHFVEVYGETYGDKYYMIIRQPPFTKNAIERILFYANSITSSQEEIPTDQEDDNSMFIDESLVKLRDTAYMGTSEYPQVINIGGEDVISYNLRHSNTAYGWYKIEDRGNFAGTTVSLGHVPALYLDKYVDVFGNRMLNVTSNYSDAYFFDHKGANNDLDNYAEQASQLLTFLVETNIYLPFTREGTITINGDRRIKKGTWIYYRPTRELFYVTSVTNQLIVSGSMIDRMTILQVERGMVIDYIKPKIVTMPDGRGGEEEVEVSYFNIVNLEKMRSGLYDVVTKGLSSEKFDYKSSISVNEKVMEFFLQKRQFDESK